MSKLEPFQPYKWEPPYDSNRRDHYPQHTKPTQPKQAPVTIYSLFPNIDRWGIGYDSVFETLTKLSTQKSSFPPYNLVKNGDSYTITMALAGFRKDDIEVFVQNQVLTVRSDIDDQNDIPDEGKYGEVIHHGIAQRNFTTTFALSEHVVVKSAKLEDGLLIITLELELPEEKKPKQIEIQ